VKQIVAWVDNEEKKALIDANKNNFPIIFAKNRKDFIEKLNPNTFPIISIKKTQKINSIREIVRSFQNIRFYALTRLDDKFTTPNEFSFIVDEPNVSNPDGSRSQYIASELLRLFEAQCHKLT